MRNSKRIIVKLFLPLILAVSLVIGEHSWADARSHNVPAKVLASAPSPTGISGRTAPHLLVRLQKKKESEVNYNLVKKDIIKILTWMDSAGVSPVELAAKFRGENCTNRIDKCPIIVHQTTPGESSLEGLSGSLSEQYIDKILIEASNQNEVYYVRVKFNDRYIRKFSAERFYQILFPNQNFEIHNGSDTNCGGPCPNPRRLQWYEMDVRNKYFSSSIRSSKYVVSVVGIYMYGTKVFSPRDITLRINRA
jgi:hypothetical protein